VLAKAIVPEVVIGPPVKPVPVATEVTVPVPGAVALMVWFGQVPVMVMLEPATKAGVAVAVPPLAMGSRPDTSVARATGLLATLTKSEPFQATNARVLAGTVTPVVGPAPRITMEPVPELMTKYALL
jgi:hypothetical protein